MPKVFRVMKKGDDERPVIEASARGLGVRNGVDVDVDDEGRVLVNGRGMSVAPTWRKLPLSRVPARLREKLPGAAGSKSDCCFTTGNGPFMNCPFAEGLELIPDADDPNHGNIAPAKSVLLIEYESALAATRNEWRVDED